MRKLVIMGLFVLTISSVFAQKNAKGTIELGGNIGYNSSIISTGNSSYAVSYVSGINIGASFDYYLSDRWSLKGKLAYDRKGWSEESLFLTSKYDVRLNYLTIPVLASWHFGGNRNWYLHFGPYVGVLLNAKITSGGREADVKELFKSSDFGLDFAVGVKISVADQLKISLEYDAQAGLTNIAKNDTKSTNIRGSLNVGVVYTLK